MACAVAAILSTAVAVAAEFGSIGGPEPANVEAVVGLLRQDAYDLELLISYGTSKGGSAGHLALAIREAGRDDDLVYSANFYADRKAEHDGRFHTDDLMLRIPKREYLFGTTSSLGDKASFGLDFGEVYKRSVVGVRVYDVPAADRQALAAFFARINDDYHRWARNTEYHDGEVKYDYLYLNCAKTIGAAFRLGAGYADLDVESAKLFSRRRILAAANANIPTEMAMKLMAAWHARGYAMDVVFYRKYDGSTYVEPGDDVAFKDLPNRFPSVLSRDFRKEQGQYEDVDNLYAMYILHNLGSYGVRVDGQTQSLAIEHRKTPLDYPAAARLALQSARNDSEGFGRRRPFVRRGKEIGDDLEETQRQTPPGAVGAPAPG